MTIGKVGYFGAQFNGQSTFGKLGITVGDEYTCEVWFRSTASFSSELEFNGWSRVHHEAWFRSPVEET